MKEHEILTKQVKSGIIIGMELAKISTRFLDLRDKINYLLNDPVGLISNDDKELLKRVEKLCQDNFKKFDSHNTVADRVIELHTRNTNI